MLATRAGITRRGHEGAGGERQGIASVDARSVDDDGAVKRLAVPGGAGILCRAKRHVRAAVGGKHRAGRNLLPVGEGNGREGRLAVKLL